MSIKRLRPRSSLRASAAALATAVLVTGCSSGKEASSTTTPNANRPSGPGKSLKAFELFDSCSSLLSYLKEEALSIVGPYGLNDGGFGVVGGVASGLPTAAAPESARSGAAPPAKDSSTTNTQVEGVDEGDVVDTDGKRVFSVVDGSLRVVDVAAGQLVGTVALGSDGTRHELMLDGNRLIVFSDDWSNPGGDQSSTVTLYDVSTNTPRQLLRQELEGVRVATRGVDGKARVVLSLPAGFRLPFVMPADGSSADEDKALRANEEVIRRSTIEDWLPRRLTKGSGSPVKAVDCSAIGRPEEFSGLSFTWVATIDMHASAPTIGGAAAVIGDGSKVYASASKLYVATTRWLGQRRGGLVPVRPEPPATSIHAFDLTDRTGARYVASGKVDGTLLNQFAMDEHEAVLRVATTSQSVGFGRATQSFVRTLKIDGDKLVQLGELGGLGKNEQIYSVRFIGHRAYVVTFRQIDPLYVVDLANPASPTLLGELKIPGFSAYLHPIGDGQLVGIGQGGTDAGRITGGQASLFDVNDPSQPKQVSTLALNGTGGAQYDHHAFLWWPATRQLFIPTFGFPIAPNVRVSPLPVNVSRVEVIAVAANGQLTRQGTIEHAASDKAFDNPIQRTLIVGGKAVTVSTSGLKVSSLDALAEQAWVAFN